MRFASAVRSMAASVVAFGREIAQTFEPVRFLVQAFVLQVILPVLADLFVRFVAGKFAGRAVAVRLDVATDGGWA